MCRNAQEPERFSRKIVYGARFARASPARSPHHARRSRRRVRGSARRSTLTGARHVARRRLHPRRIVDRCAHRPRRRGDQADQPAPGVARPAHARRLPRPHALGGLEGAPHGDLPLHGPQRPGAAGGRSVAERLAACGYSGGWGENIAEGYPTAAAVVAGWLASPGHKANIENPSYVVTGAGAAIANGGITLWAQDFGMSADSGSAPAAAARARSRRRSCCATCGSHRTARMWAAGWSHASACSAPRR